MKEATQMRAPESASKGRGGDWIRELRTLLDSIPYKGFFLVLLGCWLVLFQFLGNSTLGYVDTNSLFVWLEWMYANSADDAHGRLIPFVVAGLFWWKRQELASAAKGPGWLGLVILGLGLWLHMVGYMIQQTQISVVGFFVGLYGLMGVVWGWRWLRATFFPFCLFAFCVPIANVSGIITFPLRLLATKITGWICTGILGINVIQDGTRIFDSLGTYQYEVAAACSGIRSLTAIVALSTVYAFIRLRRPWKRLLLIAWAIPLAVVANVVRLCMIVVAAEAFGQGAGNYVHESWWLSLLPYVPAMAGMVLLGHWLREDRGVREVASDPLVAGARQES